MDFSQEIKLELQQYADRQKAEFLPKFFKAYPGGYGEGDEFIGVAVPIQRKVARKYFKLAPLAEVERLLQEPVHEYRLTALFILVYKYEKLKTEPEKKAVVDLYLASTSYVNNWDLVDASAEKILGAYLQDREKDILYEFAALPEQPSEQEQLVKELINEDGGTIRERIVPPGGYTRVEAAAGSYQQYLRDLPLSPTAHPLSIMTEQ